MKFEGELLIPEDLTGDYKVRGIIRQKRGFELYINSKKVDIKMLSRGSFEGDVNLSHGSHKLEFLHQGL